MPDPSCFRSGTRDRLRSQPRTRGFARSARPPASQMSGQPPARRASNGCKECRLALRRAEEIERRCGASTHQGICAEAGGYPYVGVEEILSAPAPLIVALDQVQDPQNLGSICRAGRVRGRDGCGDPRAALGRGHADGVQDLRRRGRASARSRGCATSPTSWPRRARPDCWCYGAGASVAEGRSKVIYDAPDYSGGVVLVLGSEGSGLRPRVAARMRSAGLAAATRAYGVARCCCRRGGAAVRDLAHRAKRRLTRLHNCAKLPSITLNLRLTP